ncbi:hypothetical protein [Nocardiopsis deserti]|uniref:hypothetical protein n=1 Tax=Nocardiopsis deserti TaxID=2605988 RepID=UPI0037421C2A
MMRRYEIPVAPVLIAVILGPLAETELRRALAIGQGDVGVLFAGPITIGIYAVLVAAVALVAVLRVRARARSRGARREETVDAG